MRRVRPLVVLAIAGVMLLPSTVTAASTVSITGVTVTGGTGSVTGTAAFSLITAAQSVGGSNTNFGNVAVADAAGINLVDAKIAPLANGQGLRFIWELAAMPAQVPPEGVRYTWSFKIGSNQYQLQAKRTNLASITTAEDPVNHIQQAAAQKEFFQLRGACVTEYEGLPTAGCYHLAFLTGAFDVANKTVSMDLPYQTKDEIGRVVAPDFKPGATIEENLTANMSITAAFQAVIGNTTTSDYTTGWTPYFVGPQIHLGVAGPTANPAEVNYTAAGVMNGSTFNGTVSGLTASKNTVYARACNGQDCAYSKFKAL
jgi:hypothetical protein